jgi:PTS system ascorbate-specific IIA component
MTTGLLIIAHAPLASALRDAALHTFPEAAQALAVCDVPPSADAEQALADATRQWQALHTTETLVLTDVFGATPCNVARQLAEQPGVRVAAGVNVPMLWRALNYRHKPLDELLALALAGAAQGVMPVAVTRPQNQAQKPASHDPIDSHHQQ